MEEGTQRRSCSFDRGARRIGKSHIVEEYGREEYDSDILVDFSKVSPQVMELFNLYLDDLDTLFQILELYYEFSAG